MDRYGLLYEITEEWKRITGENQAGFESVPDMLAAINPPPYLLKAKGLQRLEGILDYLKVWRDAAPE